jgi:hypothetical protein
VVTRRASVVDDLTGLPVLLASSHDLRRGIDGRPAGDAFSFKDALPFPEGVGRGRRISWRNSSRVLAIFGRFERGEAKAGLSMVPTHLKSRRVAVGGIAHDVFGAWVEQVARNLTAPDGILANVRYLIHDRDPLFTARFTEILKAAGVKTVRLPARSPNLNAFTERFVRSARDECLCKVIPLGERHLRAIITEYIDHYHHERNHQGLNNRLIDTPTAARAASSSIKCRERLGGTLRYYHREAA